MQMLELPDLGRLVELHHGAVVAVAYATTRDLALAEDVAQETFVVAWSARERLRDATRVRPWLCGIARNLSKNALRARRRERGGDASDEREDPRPSVVDHAIERETATALHDALAAVPDAYREPLVLFYWDGKSIAHVAASLGISEEAAQKRISRGRSYLRAELEAPLETAGRGRRSAAAAAAAVLAVLAARTGVAQAATASKGTSMTLIKGLGALAVAGLVAGTIAVTRGGASDAAPSDRAAAVAEKPTAVERPAPTVPVREPALPQAPGAEPAPVRDESLAAARGALPVPASYEITVLAATSVAIRLAGGTSEAFLFQQPAAPTFDRHVTGHVLDASGKPIGGAVVVVGSRLDGHMGSLFGSGAAKSAPDGSFSVTTHDDAAAYAIALHPRGWSSVAAVPAGRDDAKIVLTSPAAGTLVVHARQGGAPRESDVTLTAEAGGLVLRLETDARGELRVPLLAAGTYKLAVRPSQMFAGGSSLAFTRDVTIAPDGETDVPVELVTGTLVVASAFKPGMETVEYFFYKGTDVLDLATLKKRGRGGGDVMDSLLGGVDADRPAQLHDIAPGAYTLCVDAAKSLDDHYPLSCRAVTVTAGQATLEITIDIATSGRAD